jgi:hypothetical protein
LTIIADFIEAFRLLSLFADIQTRSARRSARGSPVLKHCRLSPR